MLISKRKHTKIETREVLIIRKTKTPRRKDRCAGCASKVEWLNLSETVLKSGIDALSVFRLIADGEIHFLRSNENVVFVCRKSLERELGKYTGGE